MLIISYILKNKFRFEKIIEKIYKNNHLFKNAFENI